MNKRLANPAQLKGTRVRIVYRLDRSRLKEVVADFIDEDRNGDIFLSQRPLAGTTRIRGTQVLEVWQTDRPIELPHTYKGETRLF